MPRTDFCINCDLYEEHQPERSVRELRGDGVEIDVPRDSEGTCHFYPTFQQGETQGKGFCSNHTPKVP